MRIGACGETERQRFGVWEEKWVKREKQTSGSVVVTKGHWSIIILKATAERCTLL